MENRAERFDATFMERIELIYHVAKKNKIKMAISEPSITIEKSNKKEDK